MMQQARENTRSPAVLHGYRLKADHDAGRSDSAILGASVVASGSPGTKRCGRGIASRARSGFASPRAETPALPGSGGHWPLWPCREAAATGPPVLLIRVAAA